MRCRASRRATPKTEVVPGCGACRRATIRNETALRCGASRRATSQKPYEADLHHASNILRSSESHGGGVCGDRSESAKLFRLSLFPSFGTALFITINDKIVTKYSMRRVTINNELHNCVIFISIFVKVHVYKVIQAVPMRLMNKVQ